MEEFDINNILNNPSDIEALFNGSNTDEPPVNDATTSTTSTDNDEVNEENNEDKNNLENNITESPKSIEEIFGTESVGNEDNDNKGKEPSSSKEGTSPNNKNFYSSIASALKEDGIFPDIDDESLAKIKTPEDFAEMFENQVQAKLDEKQQRVDKALNYGVELTDIQKFESTIDYLDKITDDIISDESEQGENIRRQMIYNDFINRGYSKERAEREIKKSFDSGSDIEDAKEALQSNKEFYKKSYDKLVNEAKLKTENANKQIKEDSEKLKNSILNDSKVFGDLQIDTTTRRKVLDNISKPVYKDPNTGKLLTAIQKYEAENKLDFIKNVGLLYTLTDGFKNLDSLVNSKVKKETKKAMRELENTINNTSRYSDGNLKFVSGVSDDNESYIGNGFSLDI
jgi:hypothetical protein